MTNSEFIILLILSLFSFFFEEFIKMLLSKKINKIANSDIDVDLKITILKRYSIFIPFLSFLTNPFILWIFMICNVIELSFPYYIVFINYLLFNFAYPGLCNLFANSTLNKKCYDILRLLLILLINYVILLRYSV